MVVDNPVSHGDSAVSRSISGFVGSASAIKVSWPTWRGLPGDCGTANLRSDRVRVEASVVKSVIVKVRVLYLAGKVNRFRALEALRAMDAVPYAS